MSYCLNPTCKVPDNTSEVDECSSCGMLLRLEQRYEALRPIGQGGFGRTFLAVDRSTALKSRCVIKQLYPQQMGVEGKASFLFRQEAEQLLRLGHYPSMPKFLDYFEQDGYQYLIQEFIEGQNLAEISATGRLFSEAEIFALLETLLETLEFLHYRNIIHRDVKPANIIETTVGRFVLVDLGAAKLMTGTALGQTGTVIGSAEYVAPEQLRGKAIFASDLYSLGATCISLLTGLSPFSLFDTSTGRWEWRDYLTQPVSDRLGTVLDRLLEGPTKLRYESADQVLRDLDLALERRSDVQSEEIDQWQREQIDSRIDDGPVDPWHQIDEVRSKELDASFEPSGEVAAAGKRGDRSDRKNVDRIAKVLLFLIGEITLPIMTLSWIQSSTVVESSAVVQPSIDIQATPSQTPLEKIPISKIIEPAYLRPVKPFKTIENLPSFQAMALKDGGNTVVTGSIENSELKVNFINALSREGRAAYTSSIIQLNDPLFKDNHTFSPTTIYINKENIFVYFLNISNYQTSKELVKININDKSQSLPFLLSKGRNEGFHEILPVSNGEFFNETRSNNKSATNGIWKITDDGSLKKQKSFNDPSLSVLSSDRKSIFRFIKSPSNKVSILDLDKKTEQRISTPPNLISQFTGEGNIFSVQRAGEEYLIIQEAKSLGTSGTLSEFSQILPSFYQSKALKAAERSRTTTYGGSILVWDMTQKKFKYFLPCQGKTERIAIAPDGRTLAIVETGVNRLHANNQYSSSRITVWDLPTGRLLREIDIVPEFESARFSITLAFTSDSKTLITGTQKAYADPDPKKTTLLTNAEISLWNVEELRNP